MVSDALHRVVLLDLRSLVVLYLWKGWRSAAELKCSYRAVQCLWTEAGVEATGVKVPILLLFISSRTTAAFFTAESEPLLSRGVPRALRHSPVQPVLPLPVASRRLLHCSCVLDPEEKTVLFEKEEEVMDEAKAKQVMRSMLDGIKLEGTSAETPATPFNMEKEEEEEEEEEVNFDVDGFRGRCAAV